MATYSILGDGKGKTTSAIGIALRALANNEHVLFVSYLKSGLEQSLLDMEHNYDNFEYIAQGLMGFRLEDCKHFQNIIENKMATNKYSLVVLDEGYTAVKLNCLDIKKIWGLTMNYDCDFYITGSCPTDYQADIIKYSDVVTYAQCIKHHYYSGVKARRGREF